MNFLITAHAQTGSSWNKLIAIVLVMFSSITFARGYSGGSSGTYLGLNFNLSSITATTGLEGSTSDSKYDVTEYDVLLGYLMENEFYLGATMHARNHAYQSYTQSGSAMGVSFGWMSNGWMIMGHYYLTGSQSNVVAVNDKFSSGSGMGIDIGHAWEVSGTFKLGLELSYRSMSYKDYKNASGTAVDYYVYKPAYYSPKVVMAFLF